MRTTRRQVVSGVLSSGLHVAVLALLVLGSVVSLSDAPPSDRIVGIVAPPEPSLADVIAENEQRDQAIGAGDALALPGVEIDVARIRAAQYDLFPLLTEGLPDLTPRRRSGASGAPLMWFVSELPSETGLPPLSLSDTEVDRILDDAWSRRDRWRSFAEIATLISEHDPNVGRAAELVREHVDRNLLQPYERSRRSDERFWAFLNLAVDQKAIIRFVERYVQEHPGSRVATELLFFLDELTEANRTALLTLLWTDPARDLEATREVSPEAHALAVEIHTRYVGLLQLRRIDSPDAIFELYSAGRTQILNAIVESAPEGYGQADARYLLGRISWDLKRRDEAMDWWRGIDADSRGMYAPFYERIVPEAQSPSSAALVRISGVFGAEHLAWRRASTARLAEFGYRPSDY